MQSALGSSRLAQSGSSRVAGALPHALDHIVKLHEFLIAACSVFCNWVLSLPVAKCAWHSKNVLTCSNRRNWNNVTLLPPSMQLALAFGSEDALQSGRSFYKCVLCVNKSLGFYRLDLVIWKVVAYQKPLNLCFPASKHLPDGIFFPSLHQRRP